MTALPEGLVDVHVHAARWTTLAPAWQEWARRYGDRQIDTVYRPDGRLDPAAFADHLEEQGVDVAILICEYSPQVTGIQPVEDLLPLLEHAPDRLRFLAAVNPTVHADVGAELDRQLELGAVGLKIHPPHNRVPADDRRLYPAYERCADAGIPVVFHCGSTTFPGAVNTYADPLRIDAVFADIPHLTAVLAHGGRGFWYDEAGFLTQLRENVWIEISGLPPARLPDYYARIGFERVARKMIFGTDWPGVPGIRRNAEAVAKLGLPDDVLASVLAGNARRVYGLSGD